MSTITQSITLLQGYYSYFLLSLYTESLMKQGHIPIPHNEIILPTSDINAIKLNTTRISSLLQQIKKSPKSKNVYGYLSYISSIKGLFGVCMDMHSNYPAWRKHMKEILGSQYEAYIHCIRLCRNLLTHQHTPDLRLSKYDLESQKERLLESDKRIIALSFHYKEIFGKERKGSPSYGFHISINTTTLHTKHTLFSIIDEHTMFMLAESLYNISLQFGKKK